MSLTSWFLVSSGGTRHRLPREMIFVGRDDCELMLQSRSVDKQHAVINYELTSDEHKVKDLGSLNGTFVNDVRIQEQMYITLKIDDKLRFGYDTNLFTVVRGEMTVPDEALQHEKFTSQLQLSKKPSNGEPTKSPAKSPAKSPSKTPKSSSCRPAESKAAEGTMEPSAKPAESHKGDDKMAGDIAALHRGTPLYGQPSWWGDGDADDENSFKQETKTCGKKHDSSAADGREPKRSERPREDGLGPEPSYFEIPTKEAQMAEDSIHEIPTKDTEGAAATASASTQGHASPHAFTIEFDDTSPGKVTIKDHVSKLTPDHRPRPKKASHSGSKDLSTLQAAMMVSESKVADWLAQNDPPTVRSESTEDSKSIKSDVPVHFKRLKGSKHEDGTQSDSENGIGLRFGNRRLALEERLRVAQGGQGGQGSQGGRTTSNRTAFMIEFYDDDNPRKRRSYSFSQTAPLLGGVAGEALCPTPPSHPKSPSTTTTATDFSKAPLSAALIAGAPTAARVLMKQRSEDQSIGRSSVSTGHQTTEPSPSEEGLRTPRSQGYRDREQEDDQSDKGTYTIELENRNPEEEEARRMIDKVFGVEQNQDPSVSVPVEHQQGEAGKEKKERKKTTETGETAKPSCLPSESVSENPVAVGSSRWVSQWASLSANHTRTDPEGSGAESPAFIHQQREADAFESGVSIRSASSATSSLTERKRRTLPQLPIDDPRANPGKSLSGLGLHRSEIGEKQDTEPQEKSQVEHKGDGACFASIEEGDMMKGKQKQTKAPLQASSKPPLRPMSSSEKRSEERRRRAEDRIQHHSKEGGDGGEKSGGKPLVRQGSFTIEKPSGVVPIELIPRIKCGAGVLGRERSDSVSSMDTATLLKDTEAVMAFLEAKLRDENKLDRANRAGSISPESDVDTASTYSQAAGEGEKKAAHQKRRSLSSLHKEKSNLSSTSKTAASTNARERLERKTKTRTDPSRPDVRRSVQPASSRARQPSQDLTDDDQTSSFPISDILSSDQESLYSRSYGRSHFTSTDDLLHSKLEAKSSSKTSSSKSSKTLQAATASSLGKQASLPQPRPTRTSLLRRARLGDTSDTDLPDADRMSVASEVSTTSSTSKPPSGRKGPSRLDMLAQPRRTRLGSISARSDSECTVGRSSTSSPRLSAETALRLGLRSSTPTDNKLAPRMRANSVSKLTEAKSRISPSIHSTPSESPQPEPEPDPSEEELMASNRWRRLPPEYGSTSEEEFGSNRNSPKPGRPLRPHSVLRGTRLGGSTSSLNSGQVGPGGMVLKHRMREQEEYIKDWTAHSEEIARISQDLAKDLAILAREIHDVAGEIDSVSSSGTAPSTTVSTAATTPGSAIDTREEVGRTQEGMQKLVDRVFDESLNFRKIPPMVQNKAPEINGRPVELRPRAPDSLDSHSALRRRTWNRDEAVVDSLLLTSVSQLSAKIRQSVDKTAGKIRILFKDKDRNWDEIESKLRSESDIPLLKTSNKQISSILVELKRVEKQLQVINVMVDPDGTLDALSGLGLTSPLTPKPSPGSQGPQEALPGPTVSARGNTASSAPTEGSGSGSARDLGGLQFTRIHPSGEESAIPQK
ncbi:centrosomal protein of 170 kDa isoform X3 [Salmo salar]|uniref:Centrosomal protein of 170 kDa isoform X3 n=1 Tax=Salmo salar TaxID=8030 RepID=A0A1S3Q7R3_SALSA|nr:centrosomal protein of 170 kDa isoform X3 [Salmo salar]|eukprot:XP_014035434.1 PREDICTED: centrosomal protein of 170 kDa isoform X3 [Salmo salar]